MAVDGIVVSVTASKENKEISILEVSGYLDTTTASELENALYGLLKRDQHKIIVDLARVSYISSAGWGIFIGEIKEIRSHGGDLKLTGMTGDVHEVFQLLEFNSILECYPDSDAAEAAFSEVSKPD